MGRRLEQIASTLQTTLQQLLARGLADPRVRGLITITSVKVSDDLRTARVLVSVMPEEHAELTLHGLRSAAGHIRRQAGRHVAMKSVPQLDFVLDGSLSKQRAILGAIAEAAAEFEDNDPPSADEAAAPPPSPSEEPPH